MIKFAMKALLLRVFFLGYDFAVCSGEEEDNVSIDMGGGWVYGLNVSDIKEITPLYKNSKAKKQN